MTEKTSNITEALNALINYTEACKAMIDAAAGYRKTCIEMGFSDGASEAMAVQFHCQLVASLMKQNAS